MKYLSTSVLAKLNDWLVIAPIFVYIFCSNLLFSSSFEQMPLRTIDDLAIQWSLHTSLRDISQGDFSSLLYKDHYAYGWFFYTAYEVFISPFALINSILNTPMTEKILIASAREFTTILLLATIIAIRSILVKLSLNFSSLKNPLSRSVISLLVLLNPIIGYWAGRVQPPILGSLLFLASINFLGNDTAIKKLKNGFYIRKNKELISPITLSLFLVGLSIGVKANFFLCIPAYCYFALLFGHKLKDFVIPRNFLSVILGFGIGASPGLLVHPIKFVPIYFNTINDFASNSFKFNVTERNVIDSLYLIFKYSFFGGLTLFIASGLILFSTLRGITFRTHTVNFVGLIAFVGPMVYVGTNFENISLIGSYILPLYFLFPVFFTVMILTLTRLKVRKVFIVFVVLAVVTNFFSTLDHKDSRTYYSINSYFLQSELAQSEGTFAEQNMLKKLIKPLQNRKQAILLDEEVPLPWSAYRSGFEVYYVFDNWHQASWSSDSEKVWVLVDSTTSLSNKTSSGLTLTESQIVLQRLATEKTFKGLRCREYKKFYRTQVYECIPG